MTSQNKVKTFSHNKRQKGLKNVNREDFRFWLSVTVSLMSGLAAIGTINAHLKSGNLRKPQIAYLQSWLKVISILALFSLLFATYFFIKYKVDAIGGKDRESVENLIF